MRVNIDEIKEGGLQRAWDLATEVVDEMVKGDNAGYRAKSPFHVDARLTRMERRVLFEGRARATLAAPCGRCLSPAEVEVPVDIQMTFVPDEEVRTRGEDAEDDRPNTRVKRRFAAEAVNEETYSGKVIDLHPVVREQLLLALPGYPVCQEGCKGLCSVCGANLNERECGCDRRVLDPRWAGLEKLKKP
ncbi:MAG: hypothetical protein A2V77_21645 [Anaeromyxobacter sp. RBG_16_69_14]|nr:MAG: hypothetical protein A2V77_21645 [Anaeromyxobacter sp. RBG_16_69_14]